jgi:hypothetical protein
LTREELLVCNRELTAEEETREKETSEKKKKLPLST